MGYRKIACSSYKESKSNRLINTSDVVISNDSLLFIYAQLDVFYAMEISQGCASSSILVPL
jgi:hypothetical protein